MHTPDPSVVEVSLLYPVAPELNDHVEAICETVEDHGAVVLEVIEINPTTLAVICDDVRVVVTDTDGPVPTAPLHEAARPVSPEIGDPALVSVIDAHACGVTFLIMDPERVPPCGSADLDVKRAIAWDLAHCLASESAADLIHWRETDTLYSVEEFQRTAQDTAAQHDAPYPAHPDATPRPSFMQSAPEILDPSEVWLDGQPPLHQPAVLGDGPMPETRARPARAFFPFARIREVLHLRRTLHGIALTVAGIAVQAQPLI